MNEHQDSAQEAKQGARNHAGLGMYAARRYVYSLLEQNALKPQDYHQALEICAARPSTIQWRRFLSALLMWLGVLSVVAAVLFFIAYNWTAMGVFGKFALVESFIIGAVACFIKYGGNHVAGKASIFAASIFIGVLLALCGQTYQTGADPWQLFFVWSLMIIPFAYIARFTLLWLFIIFLSNLTVILYFQVANNMFGFAFGVLFGSIVGTFWALFVVNTSALVLWELAVIKCKMTIERWPVQLLAIASAAPIGILVFYDIFDEGRFHAAATVLWLVWIAVMIRVYRYTIRDLFMLTLVCAQVMFVLTILISKYILDDAGSFLFIGLLVIGMGTVSSQWIKKVHKEWQS